MRKRFPFPRLVASMLLITPLALACDRSSPGGDSAARSPTIVGSPVMSADGAATSAAPERPRAEALAVRADRAAASNAGGAAAPALGRPIPPLDPSGAMLIRSGQATLEVRRLDDAVAVLRRTAGELGGFVANTSIAGGDDRYRTATLEIRVPSARFDAVITALGTLGKVETVSASVEDVGDEYVDLGARAANARHMEARLVEMLATRTGKLSDVLTVEQELRRVREEIERYDARLKWLERRTALSSIAVTLHEPVSVLDQRGPSPIAEAFADAWRRAVGVVAWCIASLGVLIPVGALVGGVLALVRRLLRPAPASGAAGA